MEVSKVQLANGEVLVDLTNDSVTPDKLAEGTTAHDASGAQITGTMKSGGGGGASVQADLAQNDPSQPDYVKNRTHWAEDPITSVESFFPETLIAFEDGYWEAPLALNIVPDTEYTVVFDGVPYTCTSRVDDELAPGVVIFGNELIIWGGDDNGLPFGVLYAASLSIINFVTNDMGTTEHTISISRTVITQEIHKLDDKYINADWMAQRRDEAKVALEEMTAVITNEGYDVSGIADVDAIAKADYLEVIWNGERYKCQVQNVVDPGSGASVSIYGNASIAGASIDTGEPFVFISIMGMFLAITSTEIEATFSIVAHNYVADSVIPRDFLPEELRFGDEYEAKEPIGNTITWDGDTTGKESIGSEFWRVSSATVTLEELKNGGTIVVRADGSMKQFTADDVGDIDNLGAILSIGSIIHVVTDRAAEMGVPYVPGVYFSSNVAELTLNNGQFVDIVTKIKPIDSKYLPANIGGGIVTLYIDPTGEDKYLYKKQNGTKVDRITYAELLDIVSNGRMINLYADVSPDLLYINIAAVQFNSEHRVGIVYLASTSGASSSTPYYTAEYVQGS